MKSNINIQELAIRLDTDSLYENAPCGYISFIPDGTIFKINKTLLEWLQLTHEEAVYRLKFSDIISKGGNIHFEMFFRPMITVYGSVKELRYEMVRKDGSIFTVLISANTIKDNAGKLEVINAAVYDITDRKKYEHELLLAKRCADEERAKFTTLADLTPEIIWTASPNGKIEYVNLRFFIFCGIRKTSVSNLLILSKVHPEDRRKLIGLWVQSLHTGDEFKCEIRLLNGNRAYIWHLVRAKPNFSEDNQISNWFGICLNIDEHVTALKQKDDFIGIASHELKTPITSLKASLQLLDRLKHNSQDTKLPRLIEQANKSMQKISTLIDDLLNVSRLQKGFIELNKTMFTMKQFCAACLSALAFDPQFKIVVQGNLDISVTADINRIEQVVVNFITNAIKYAPDSKTIYVTVERQNQFLKLSVKDNGPGIAPDKIPHLFERYYRIAESNSRYSGLGLGLYICADIIERHGGEIGVVSELGKGSAFWFTLPFNDRQVIMPQIAI